MAHPESDRPAVDIRVLGALEIFVNGRRVKVAGRRSRGLVGLLARRPGQQVSTAEVLRQVWGEDAADQPGETARNAVQARVSAVRRALGAPLIQGTEAGYVLDVPAESVDAVRFESEVRRARAWRADAAMDTASQVYAQALALWQDERAYADLGHVDALAEEAERLGELRLQVLQESLALEIERGRYDHVAETLVDATRRYPGAEELWALRMIGLYRQGRQAEAMSVYVEARRQLRDRFGLDPSPRLRELEAMVLHQRAPRGGGLRHLGPPRVARPATSFIGREADVHEVVGRLPGTRLLTLTGAGGVGKTRLAMEAVQTLVDGCSPLTTHGVTVVDLIEYRPGDDLAVAVLDALGPLVPSSSSVASGQGARTPVDVLCDVLSDRRLVLVLDNCEHLIDDAAELAAALLARTTATHVLATSREALNVPGEVVYVVDPLRVPDGDAEHELEDNPAVQLFLDRVRATQPDLELDPERLRIVVSICRRLDGLPLALELAAVRIRVLGIEEVARLLDDRFEFLRHGARTAAQRHRTLEAVVDWSYNLLDQDDRQMFEVLSVFRGSFSIQEAVTVWTRLGGSAGQARESIERLASRSMVQAEGGRLRMLETMRAYAGAKLAESGRESAVTEAHARVYTELAWAQADTLKTEGQAHAVAVLMAEDANLRAAHTHAVSHGLGEVAQGLVGALGYLSWMREGRVPGWEMIVRSLELPAADPAVRISALAWATHLGSIFGHAHDAVDYGAETAALASEHPGRRVSDVGFALLARAHALHRLGRWADGDAQLREARALMDEHGDQWTLAGCAMVAGLGALVRGRLEEAERSFVEAGQRYRDQWGQQRSALRRSIVRAARGDHAGAARLLREALSFLDGLEVVEAAAPARVVLARAELFSGHVDTARQLVEELESGGVIGRLSEVSGRVRQCRAVLAEYDGSAEESVELHLSAARRLLDAGLPAEAVESLARAVVLTGPDSARALQASEDAERAARDTADPRVRATVLDLRALMRPWSPQAARAAADARAVREEHGLALPALLRERPWSPDAQLVVGRASG